MLLYDYLASFSVSDIRLWIVFVVVWIRDIVEEFFISETCLQQKRFQIVALIFIHSVNNTIACKRS